MKEILKDGSKLFLRTILINIMCFFVVISFSVLTTALFTENIGYKAIGVLKNSSNQEELYTYYYDSGEDTEKVKYEEKGYIITENSIRSDISKTGTRVFLIISQTFCILILATFVYPNLWQLGTKDSNLVKFKHKKEDKYKGVKIGFIAAIPQYLFWIFITVAHFGLLKQFPIALYKFANSSVYSFIDVIFKGTITVGDAKLWQLLLLLLLPLLVPLFAGAGYILGYNNYSLSEKLIYKKK